MIADVFLLMSENNRIFKFRKGKTRKTRKDLDGPTIREAHNVEWHHGMGWSRQFPKLPL